MKKYIEREAVLSKLRNHYPKPDDMIASVVTIPAADVRPVVRGKWFNYGDEYRPDIKCCVCGQRKPILLGNFSFNYCPNCGAKMSGGTEEEK